jgi:hypothetical protein
MSVVDAPATFVHKLRSILFTPSTRGVAIGSATVYLILFLVALGDISTGGGGFGWQAAEWTRMFERAGPATFEPVARLTVPGLTVLFSHLNVAIGLVLSGLASLNLAVTWFAFRHPRACRFHRAAGLVAGLPALLAGGACCAPGVVLILGLQVSSLAITFFQILIPVSAALLVLTLALIVGRTEPSLAVD